MIDKVDNVSDQLKFADFFLWINSRGNLYFFKTYLITDGCTLMLNVVSPWWEGQIWPIPNH